MVIFTMFSNHTFFVHKGKSWLILGSIPLYKLVTKEYEKL